MDFKEAMRTLYKGYLYQLIVLLAVLALSLGLAIAIFLSTIPALPTRLPRPAISGASAPMIFAVAGLALIGFLLAALILVFFLYIFRGYRALHRLGVKWAWWLAWGPIAMAALVAIFAAALALYRPALLARIEAYPMRAYEAILEEPMLLGIFIVVEAMYLLLVVAKALTLNDLRKRAGVGLFAVALVLLIIGFLLSYLPSVYYVGGLVLFAEYIAEMLAYREAAR